MFNSVGVPNSRPWRRGRHGVAGESIRLENWTAPFGGHRCEAILAPGRQNTIGAAIETVGGDALSGVKSSTMEWSRCHLNNNACTMLVKLLPPSLHLEKDIADLSTRAYAYILDWFCFLVIPSPGLTYSFKFGGGWGEGSISFSGRREYSLGSHNYLAFRV
jgi:hypothetical protein